MDRRRFLEMSLVGAAFAPVVGKAQTTSGTTPPATPPPFPPADARSVWLVGDSAPPDPVKNTQRLLELLQARPKIREGYLSGGATGEMEARFAKLLGKEDCAFLATGTPGQPLGRPRAGRRRLTGDRSARKPSLSG